MAGTDLKRSGGKGGGVAFPPLAGAGDDGASAPARGLRPRRWAAALALSLVIHAGGVWLLWALSLGGVGGTGGRAVVDTRVAAGPEADVFVFLSDDAPRPRPRVTPPPAPSVGQAYRPDGEPDPQAGKPDLPEPTVPRQSAGQHPAADGGGDGSNPPRARAANSFFRIPARGQRLVFVIDRSASMGLDGAFPAARRELSACLDELTPETQFQVIAYNRGAETLRVGGRSGLLPASADCKRQARRLLDGLRAEGGTDHLAALRRALLLRPDVLFFLTDADDLTEAQVREVTRFNRGRTVIHTVGLTGTPHGPAPHPLQTLAAQNRGVYRGVDLARNGDR